MDTSGFREAGHEVVEMMAEYLETIESRPLFPDVTPDELRELFRTELPEKGMSMGDLLEELRRDLLPHSTHVNHPGYFGLMTATPSVPGILADLIASTLNQNVGTYTISPAATEIERRTVRWLTDLVGWGPDAGGNLTSGGTMANLLGLKLARDAGGDDRPQEEGVGGEWAAYVSEERHVSVDKSLDMIGLGRTALRVLPTDDEFRLRTDALEEAIARDRARGARPFCIIAIAGTTNTGSVDPLPELARIARRERMWLHVDAAYGGGVLLSEKHRDLLEGIEAADSITVDPHKWFYAPLDVGAALVKDESRLTASFGLRPPYLTDEMDTEGERYQYYVHGFEQSRRFRSLKVWMSLKRYGSREIARWIESDIAHARHLADLCRDTPDMRPLIEPRMSAICLRYEPPDVAEPRIASIHRRVARRIEEEGEFWVSTTRLKGESAFRINPINYRTRPEHIERLFERLLTACRDDLQSEEPPSG